MHDITYKFADVDAALTNIKSGHTTLSVVADSIRGERTRLGVSWDSAEDPASIAYQAAAQRWEAAYSDILGILLSLQNRGTEANENMQAVNNAVAAQWA